uniref:Uncharacterized protein n=1 Tax=Chromera velia CCMP2878 TaxID=1169474 RepID=A0A0G4F0U3_9ALVE|eukprot:Cvel_14378.t1-p1 / transcript=Cvel_14378.t1 / gene=Cvel_14378 / organism=Chromera_velia_CCMP2878 / gene_product=hypothetical protein / transcript_product=hypothetical protein / location=Cvel_scaffold1020:34641-41420(+) / protein_length=961 / sequence_SO=supercontig / SO=protein_coding / is_pseudo=false
MNNTEEGWNPGGGNAVEDVAPDAETRPQTSVLHLKGIERFTHLISDVKKSLGNSTSEKRAEEQKILVEEAETQIAGSREYARILVDVKGKMVDLFQNMLDEINDHIERGQEFNTLVQFPPDQDPSPTRTQAGNNGRMVLADMFSEDFGADLAVRQDRVDAILADMGKRILSCCWSEVLPEDGKKVGALELQNQSLIERLATCIGQKMELEKKLNQCRMEYFKELTQLRDQLLLQKKVQNYQPLDAQWFVFTGYLDETTQEILKDKINSVGKRYHEEYEKKDKLADMLRARIQVLERALMKRGQTIPLEDGVPCPPPPPSKPETPAALLPPIGGDGGDGEEGLKGDCGAVLKGLVLREANDPERVFDVFYKEYADRLEGKFRKQGAGKAGAADAVLQDQLQKSQAELKEATSRIQALEKELQEKSERLSKEEEAGREAQEEVRRLQKRVAELEAEVENIGASHRALVTKYEELKNAKPEEPAKPPEGPKERPLTPEQRNLELEFTQNKLKEAEEEVLQLRQETRDLRSQTMNLEDLLKTAEEKATEGAEGRKKAEERVEEVERELQRQNTKMKELADTRDLANADLQAAREKAARRQSGFAQTEIVFTEPTQTEEESKEEDQGNQTERRLSACPREMAAQTDDWLLDEIIEAIIADRLPPPQEKSDEPSEGDGDATVIVEEPKEAPPPAPPQPQGGMTGWRRRSSVLAAQQQKEELERLKEQLKERASRTTAPSGDTEEAEVQTVFTWVLQTLGFTENPSKDQQRAMEEKEEREAAKREAELVEKNFENRDEIRRDLRSEMRDWVRLVSILADSELPDLRPQIRQLLLSNGISMHVINQMPAEHLDSLAAGWHEIFAAILRLLSEDQPGFLVEMDVRDSAKKDMLTRSQWRRGKGRSDIAAVAAKLAKTNLILRTPAMMIWGGPACLRVGCCLFGASSSCPLHEESAVCLVPSFILPVFLSG